MKEHAILNYYDNIEVYLEDSSKNYNKLYWRLMKDSYNIKLSNEIPPIQIFNERGIKSMAYSDFDKIEALNMYFSSTSSIDDSNETLQTCIICVMILLCNITINKQEVMYIISVLTVNKAIGPDFISHKMLKSNFFYYC